MSVEQTDLGSIQETAETENVSAPAELEAINQEPEENKEPISFIVPFHIFECLINRISNFRII